MKIWLDDQRVAPDGWVHLHSFDEVQEFIDSVSGMKDFSIDEMSFDFHLSDSRRGIDVMRYLADLCLRENVMKFWPKRILYHSDDGEAREMMRNFVTEFEGKVSSLW